MRLSFKKKIRQKYVTKKVRKEVQDLFSQIQLYEYYIQNGEVEEKHNSVSDFKSNRVSKPTEHHLDKIKQMESIVKNFYRRLGNIKKQMNSDELKIFKSYFIDHEEDIDIMLSLNMQRVKYYELKGYIYFLLAVGFNIIDTIILKYQTK